MRSTLYVKPVIIHNCFVFASIKSIIVYTFFSESIFTTGSVKRGCILGDNLLIFVISNLALNRCAGCDRACAPASTVGRAYVDPSLTFRERLSPCLAWVDRRWRERLEWWKYRTQLAIDSYVGYPILACASIYTSVILSSSDDLSTRGNFVITWW